MKLIFHAKDKKRGGPLRTYYHPTQDRSRRRLVIFGIVVAGIGSILLFRGIYGFFRVRTIVCQTSQGECPEEDKKLTEAFIGRSVFESFSLHSPGKTYTITKKFPHTVRVNVEDIPIAFILYLDEAAQQKIAVSTDGVVYSDSEKVNAFSASASAQLIDISFPANTQSVSSEQMRVYETLIEFAKKNAVDRILLKSREEIQVHIKPDLTAIVSSESIDKQLHSLQLILSSPTIEQRSASVDLRFEHPVLRYL